VERNITYQLGEYVGAKQRSGAEMIDAAISNPVCARDDSARTHAHTLTHYDAHTHTHTQTHTHTLTHTHTPFQHCAIETCFAAVLANAQAN
jgi:hypothetical protein